MSLNQQTCPRCGTRLERDLPGSLCLNCLLALGLKQESTEPAGSPPEVSAVPDEFERFRILEQIGEGGCGIVYRAEQLQPVQRTVALKVIKLGLDSQSVIARFDAERQALALMDHPGIAKVFDAGTSRRGRPFFAMELVPGERITDYCDRQQLSIVQRLGLFAQICDAVQHAHQKGVIHRDLKPSNILVTEQGGVVLPKVIDFGLAKATSRQRLADQTLYTAFDQFVGTPAYMSPEQAGATAEQVDTRTDIYALGVLLYELVTGRAPFEPERLRQAAVDEVFRIIREEDPARPSTRLTTLSAAELADLAERRMTAPPKLLREVRGDLDWVVMRALEKLPARRYATANALAAEVRRYLNDEPVVARPPSAGYRFQKLVRRNRLAVTAGVVVFLTLLGGSVFSTWSFFREQEARQRAVSAESRAVMQAQRSDQVAQLLKDMLASAGPSVALGRDTVLLREILDRTAERTAAELKASPELEAEMREIIGRAYYDLGELDKAEAMYRAILRLRQPMVGETNAAVLDAMGELGSILTTRAGTEDLAEGESLLRRVVNGRRESLGDSHPELAKALHLLGLNFRAQRKINEMNAAFKEAESIQVKLRGTNSPRLVPDEEETPHRVEALAAKAISLRDQGKPAEAEAVAREAITLHRKLYPRDTETLAPKLSTLAISLSDQGKSQEAEVVIREAITLLRRFRGNEHPHLANFLLNTLAKILQDQEKWAEAEEVGRELIPLQKMVSPHRIQARLDATHLLGIAHLKQQHWAEAEQILRESVELCERPLESGRRSNPTRCARLKRMLGEALLRQQKFVEAETKFLAAHAGLVKASGMTERRDLEKCLLQMTELCEVTERPGEAARWRKELEEFRKSGQGDNP